MGGDVSGVIKESGDGGGLFTWISQRMLCGGQLGLIGGGLVSEYGLGGAQGFVEKCGWGGVVDEFERGAPGYGDE
jgi:hypothetical protein